MTGLLYDAPGYGGLMAQIVLSHLLGGFTDVKKNVVALPKDENSGPINTRRNIKSERAARYYRDGEMPLRKGGCSEREGVQKGGRSERRVFRKGVQKRMALILFESSGAMYMFYAKTAPAADSGPEILATHFEFCFMDAEVRYRHCFVALLLKLVAAGLVMLSPLTVFLEGFKDSNRLGLTGILRGIPGKSAQASSYVYPSLYPSIYHTRCLEWTVMPHLS